MKGWDNVVLIAWPQTFDTIHILSSTRFEHSNQKFTLLRGFAVYKQFGLRQPAQWEEP